MKEFIYEVVIYDGSQKAFRILNVNSGTVYSSEYENQELASNNIKEGEVRGGKTVKQISLADIYIALMDGI